MNFSTRAAAALASGVLLISLAACADDDSATPEGTVSASSSSPTTGPATDAPTDDGSSEVSDEYNDADVTFAQLMTVHHEGALDMAALAEQKAESAEVQELASEIKAAQVPEIELMKSWLNAWGEPLQPMDDEDMNHDGMDMNGASQDQVMDRLQQLSGPDFDDQFLTDMIAHHEGAVVMAEEELTDGLNPDALSLARDIIDAQKIEIDLMQQLRQQS